MTKRYVVEFTESKNNYTYTGEWYQEIVDDVDEGEAIEFVKELFEYPEDYIFRAHEYFA